MYKSACDQRRLSRRARSRGKGIRIAWRGAAADRRAADAAGADDRHAVAADWPRAYGAAQHHRRRAAGHARRRADGAAPSPRSAARDWRGSVVLRQRAGGDPHRAQAAERSGRDPRHPDAGREESVPVGEAAEGDWHQPRGRRISARLGVTSGAHRWIEEEEMIALDLRRRFYAEEIEAVARL